MKAETVALSQPEALLYLAGQEAGLAQGLKTAATELKKSRDAYARQIAEMVDAAPKKQRKEAKKASEQLGAWLEVFDQVIAHLEQQGINRQASAGAALNNALGARSKESPAAVAGKSAARNLLSLFGR
jgi:hypothetical protein